MSLPLSKSSPKRKNKRSQNPLKICDSDLFEVDFETFEDKNGIGDGDENEEPKEEIDQKIENFRIMIKGLNGFVCPTKREFLLRFLRVRKFDLEAALKTLQNYYGMRRDDPEMFIDLYPSTVAKVYQNGITYLSPKTDPLGRTIFLIRPKNWIPSENIIKMEDITRANYLIYEELVRYEINQKKGLIMLVDLENLNMQQIRKFNFKALTRMVKTIQGSFPLKIKGVHIINQNSIFKVIYNMVYPFIKEKIRKRVVLHRDLNSLHSHLSPEILPEFLGGKCSEDSYKSFIQIMLRDEEYFKDLLRYGYQNVKYDK